MTNSLEAQPVRVNYKWWALSCTALGMLLATVNSGTLIIALPDLERALHTGLLTLVWVILVYMIASTVLVLTAGRLSDMFGRKTAYVAGFVVFSLASLGAGFAHTGLELIVWRLAQGIGGAFIFANAAAIVADAFPRAELGVAMGTNTMVAAVGLVVGPVLGGLLVQVGWQWVFWFNVPLGILGSVWAWWIVRDVGKLDDVHGLDLLGNLTFVGGLTGLVFGVSRGGLASWTDPWTLGGIVLGIVLLPLFVLVERRHRAPMLDLAIFEHPLFAMAAAAAFLNGLSRFALTFLFVFYFQGPQGDDAITAGIKLTPLALGMLFASPFAGWWADRRGSRGIAVAGMLVQAVGLAGMTMLDVHTSFWWTGTWLAIVGVGSGMFNSPNTAAMMGVVAPVRRGVAAGARVMLQNTGAVLSIAALIAIVTTGVPKDVMFSIFSGLTSGLAPAQLAPFIHNMHVALWALAAISVLGAVVSWMRPRHAVATEAGHVDHPVDEAIGELAGAPGFGGDATAVRR